MIMAYYSDDDRTAIRAAWSLASPGQPFYVDRVKNWFHRQTKSGQTMKAIGKNYRMNANIILRQTWEAFGADGGGMTGVEGTK